VVIVRLSIARGRPRTNRHAADDHASDDHASDEERASSGDGEQAADREAPWDDVRTILLILPILFLAISASFDSILVANPEAAAQLINCGFLLCVLATEIVLRGLRMRLPGMFRLPFYLMLAHLFWYPVALSEAWNSPTFSLMAGGFALHWGIALHSALGGIAMLTLLPAVAWGRALVRDNGTPWKWPWYPMPLFVVMAAGLGWRTYLLSRSFGVETFEPVTLIPLLLGCLIVAVEVGASVGRWEISVLAMCAGAILPILAIPTNSAISADHVFHDELLRCVGSPVLLSIWGFAILASYAWARRTPCGELGLAVALIAAAAIPSSSLGGVLASHPRSLPLLLLAAIQLRQAFPGWRSHRLFLAAAGLFAAAGLEFQGSRFLDMQLVIVAHAIWLTALVIGVACRDDFARFLRFAAGTAGIGCALLPWIDVDLAMHIKGAPIVALPPIVESTSVAYVVGVAVLLYGCWRWGMGREGWTYPVAIVANACSGTALLARQGG
ncbi:MAG: hypothetical protein N2C14_00660, partial [Planctomycetales bacterium]